MIPRISDEVWNIATASTALLLVTTAMTTAVTLENSSLADSSLSPHSSTKLLALSFSFLAFSSLPATACVPWLRRYFSHRTLVVMTALLHLPLYFGLWFLRPILILVGAGVTGAADSVVGVVVKDYVTCVSGRRRVERNLTYTMLVLSFNTVLSSGVSYACLGGDGRMDHGRRVAVYGTCVGGTLCAALLALVAMKPASLSENGEEDGAEIVPDEPAGGPHWYSRHVVFMKEHMVQGIGLCSVVVGIFFTYPLILLTCIRNTFHDELLIPQFGFILGGSATLTNSVFHALATRYGYRTLAHVLAWLQFISLLTILSVFPPHSLYSPFSSPPPLIASGPWVIYPLAALIGITVTINQLLLFVTAGRISTMPHVMRGLKPDSIFAWCVTLFNASAGVIFLFTSHQSVYILVLISFIGLLVQYSTFLNNLLVRSAFVR